MAFSVLVTGSSSFLAAHFIEAARGALAVTTARRPDARTICKGRFDAVLNFASHPSYYSERSTAETDIDRAVAMACKDCEAHFFMMSSRLVYGAAAGERLLENLEPCPLTIYARNKAQTETSVRNLLGDRATIVRLGNIFGMELGRRTFTGVAMTSLRSAGQIVLDMSGDTRRDFLPCTDFAAALSKLIPLCPGSVVNLGSGIATSVGDMAKWIIKGYGSGEVISTSPDIKDSFCLDTCKLEEMIGPTTTQASIRENAIESGRRLRLA